MAPAGFAVRTFPRREVVRRHAVIGLRGGHSGHVDDDRIADELVERNLIDRAVALCEVNRRVDVRAAVLGGREVVRGVVVALRRDAVGDLVEPEALSRRPEDGLFAVVVREIDERAGRPARRIRWPRTSRCQDGHEDNRRVALGPLIFIFPTCPTCPRPPYKPPPSKAPPPAARASSSPARTRTPARSASARCTPCR